MDPLSGRCVMQPCIVGHRRAGRRAGAFSTLVAALLTLAGPAAVVAQEGSASDTVPLYDLDSLVVSVLGTPVRLSTSAYPVSVVSERELRQGKTGMFLEEALATLPGVQVQNRFNY